MKKIVLISVLSLGVLFGAQQVASNNTEDVASVTTVQLNGIKDDPGGGGI